jgi:RNA polymerase sigma factor (sigma-70 family)
MVPQAKLGLPLPFDEAMRRHEGEIMRFLSRMTGDREDALDLYQETWLRAYRAYPELDYTAGVRPWLFRIASNLCRNRVRDMARRRRVISPESQLANPGDVPAGSPRLFHDGALDLKRAILALPGRQGQAFVMRKLVGLNYAEIAEAIGCSEESARASVYQALQKLRAVT